MKKLSIVMPQYNEDEATCYDALNMLNSQLYCSFSDYEVIIVNDCSTVKLSKEFLDQFKNLEIKYISTEKNGGPGMARQRGLDYAKGDYVTFIDIDDTWITNLAFHFFENEIYPKSPNCFITNWLETGKNGTGPVFLMPHGEDMTWMFGKFWKRESLKFFEIKHHPELRVHEDSYFNRTAFSVFPQNTVLKSDFVIYLWRTAEDSITRANGGAYAFNSFATYLRANDLVLEWKKKKGQDIAGDAAQNLIYTYFVIFNPEWEQERAKPYIEMTEKMASYFLNKYKEDINKLDFQTTMNIYKNTMNHASHQIPKIGWDEWIKKISDLNITSLPEYSQPDITIFKKGH